MPEQETRKRRASEPVDLLLTRSEGSHVAVEKRPISTSLGAFFVFARGFVGLFWLAGFYLAWPTVAAEEGLSGEISSFALWVVIAFGGLASIVSMSIATLVYRGSNWARLVELFGVTFSIITSAVGYFANGEKITIDTTLLTLALDILVLLALSSRDARSWARLPRAQRQ
ncbi:hypothetical protein QBL02_08075 [Leucobacter sp. UT-8R-CII-1-4]|uniref:hypothetical protein n=1 Tax=Leucobacter sp. UT-8R-CII-1-4 TaxID=3040075 RepID=UPI0024A8D265|nr:hypothetical protein [Leucobacter sp. UT-8R-CII-1-4]MDI6023499.1 hypothetical protein [Leucobacter sp. UT-8R-CII-1-4]